MICVSDTDLCRQYSFLLQHTLIHFTGSNFALSIAGALTLVVILVVMIMAIIVGYLYFGKKAWAKITCKCKCKSRFVYLYVNSVYIHIVIRVHTCTDMITDHLYRLIIILSKYTIIHIIIDKARNTEEKNKLSITVYIIRFIHISMDKANYNFS